MSDPETPPPIPQGTPELDPYQTPVTTAAPHYQPHTPPGQDSTMRMLLPVGRSWMAIAAGYLALFSLFLLPAPLALLFGILGLRDIKKSQETANPKHGKVRCFFAIIVGGIGTGILLWLGALWLIDRR